MKKSNTLTKMLAGKAVAFIVLASLIITPVSTQANPPEGNAAMLRLSFMFGNGSEPTKPWIGLNLSQREKVSPWEKEERKAAESSVSFNLEDPELAFVNQSVRTVISFGEHHDKMMIGCGGEVVENKKDNTTEELAIGTTLIIGLVTYYLIETPVLATGC